MKNFQLFRYLKKWMPFIIAFFIIMTALAYKMLESRQKYTASAVIEYSNAEAASGLAPDGTAIDVTEIYSSANMTKVMSNLGLSPDNYSLDALCASIRVEPVIKEEAAESGEEESEENRPKPTAYIVSCTLDSSSSRSRVRDILNELLDVYFSDFSSKHINQEQVNNQTKDLANTDYDYLEMVESIDQQLTETIWALDARHMRMKDFRSADTGYSFADLCNQFILLQDIEVSKLYAQVLGNRITKDRDLLINKYQNRIASYGLTGEKARESSADVQEVIASYVEKMRQSGNTDIDHNYILNDIYDERWESGSLVNRTGEYDELLRNWTEHQNSLDYSLVDIAYCEYVIGVYRDGNTQLVVQAGTGSPPAETETGGEGTGSEESGAGAPAARNASGDILPISIVPPSQSGVTSDMVEGELRSLLDRMNELYRAVDRTNSEYNEYLGAATIRILSSVAVHSAYNMRAYLSMIAVFFLVVGCCGAILFGRLGDILEYLFLKDHLTGCMNRLSFDNYIREWEKRPLLPLEMCCMNLQIMNQRDMNDTYGREAVDHATKEFGRILRELFEARKNSFVGYNGSGQFWAFFERDAGETAEQELERFTVVVAQVLPDIRLQFQAGAVGARETASFRIRGLISQAVKARKPYVTGRPAGEGGRHEEGAPETGAG
ncbi:MAG: GGDEF domain-containing protein [Provencibacterium sp.]|nr:GGDEF domain-containing protein [Provencibacterium sp.]